MDALRHLLGELAKVARSKELKADIAKYQQLLGVTAGKDLKAALIAFDRAVPGKIETSSRESQEVVQAGNKLALLHNNPVVAGGEATLFCTLPTEGRLTIRLWSLDARPVRFILLDEAVAAGTGEYPIDTGGLPPGVYLVRVEFTGASNVALHQQQVLRLVVQ